jgi:hypothetical protein
MAEASFTTTPGALLRRFLRAAAKIAVRGGAVGLGG